MKYVYIYIRLGRKLELPTLTLVTVCESLGESITVSVMSCSHAHL